MNCYGKKVFLTAEWKHLAMLNYEIDPIVLVPLVPAGTELDLWNGKTLVSVVGFLFVKTRVFGIPIPFHRDFEEVNLRIYVRRKAEGRWRRGVVLIKEIVPRAAIALAARKLYNEPYLALPMAHRMICCSLVCCSLGSDLNTKHSAKPPALWRLPVEGIYPAAIGHRTASSATLTAIALPPSTARLNSARVNPTICRPKYNASSRPQSPRRSRNSAHRRW